MGFRPSSFVGDAHRWSSLRENLESSFAAESRRSSSRVVAAAASYDRPAQHFEDYQVIGILIDTFFAILKNHYSQ